MFRKADDMLYRVVDGPVGTVCFAILVTAVIAFAVFGVLCAVEGCSEGELVPSSDRFDSHGAACHVIVDRETGVQYLYAYRNGGVGMTVLVDADGKPLLAEGYE